MLSFAVYHDGSPVPEYPLHQAHLLGTDDIGVQGEISIADGRIICEKRSVEASALALLAAVVILLALVLVLYWIYDRIVGIDNVKLG